MSAVTGRMFSPRVSSRYAGTANHIYLSKYQVICADFVENSQLKPTILILIF
jgi:hypothetical protein